MSNKVDWLKTAADKLLSNIMIGEIVTVYASRGALHEIDYVSKVEGVP